MQFSTKTYFGDLCLEDYGIVVERIHDDISQARVSSDERPIGYGDRVDYLSLEPKDIELECRAFCDSWDEFERLKRKLAPFLISDEEKPLMLRSCPGMHYMAHYSSYDEGDREGTGIAAFNITFTASDPVKYGQETTTAIPGTMAVNGTSEADYKIVANDVRGTMSGGVYVWGYMVDGEEFRVILPSSSASVVEITSSAREKKRTVLVDGVTSIPTLDSDWPVLEPGEHTFEPVGSTGSATVTWTERYL